MFAFAVSQPGKIPFPNFNLVPPIKNSQKYISNNFYVIVQGMIKMLNYCRLAEIEYDASTEGDIKVLNFKGGLIEAVDYKFSMFINFLSRKPTVR